MGLRSTVLGPRYSSGRGSPGRGTYAYRLVGLRCQQTVHYNYQCLM